MTSIVMDEETYLSIKGASRQDIGDSAFHKNKGSHSNKTWSKMIDRQAEKDRRLIIRREELREEYWQKVENGEIREPTRNEKLIATANGNPDNECTIAARRLLNKKGIDWRLTVMIALLSVILQLLVLMPVVLIQEASLLHVPLLMGF